MKNLSVRYFLLLVCATVTLAPAAAGQTPETQALGVIRIGVAPPSVQLGPASPLDSASEAVRAVITKYLTGPSFEIVPLAAPLPAQAEAEAIQKGCNFVLHSGFSAKPKGLPGLGLLRGASQMTSMIPMLSAVHGVAGTIAGAAAGTVLSGAAAVASMIKAKSEVSFQYKLTAGGNPTPVLADVLKTKTTEDGQDVLSSMVEKAAAAWSNAMLNKK